MMGDMSDQPRLFEDLRDTYIPVVALWQGSELRSIPAVNVDNNAGVTATMTHLVELGHRRIAFIGGRLLGDIQERQQAYAQAMASIHAEVPAGYIQRVDNTAADGEAALAAVMALPVPPTAVVAATDVLAIGILRGAHVSGISVPAGLSVVGFDDISWAATTVPALTTVRMPTAEMATAAVNLAILLVAEPAGEEPAAEHVLVFRPELVIRESTAPPPKTPGAKGQLRRWRR
jgi:LacI family transcriptional regulator